MKERIRIYRLFSPTAYRVILNLVLPVVILLLELLNTAVVKYSLMSLFGGLWMMGEIMGDLWFLNGICQKNALSMDFLKASDKGMSYLSGLVSFDMLRKLGEILGLCVIDAIFLTVFTGEAPLTIWVLLLGEAALYYGLTVVVVTITRHFDNVQMVMLPTSLAVLIATWTMTAMSFVPYIVAPIALVFAIVASIICYIHTKKKVEEGFYDTRS